MVFVPSDEAAGEDDGWLMGYVYDAPRDASDLVRQTVGFLRQTVGFVVRVAGLIRVNRVCRVGLVICRSYGREFRDRDRSYRWRRPITA